MYAINIQDVYEYEEPTYQPEDEQVNTATSTHVLLPKTEELEYQPRREYTPTQLEVIDKIKKAFPDAPVMVEVARCESEFDPTADRGNLGVDVGLFQINQVHLAALSSLGLDRWNIDDNISYARLLYDQAGTQPWFMSQSCWG